MKANRLKKCPTIKSIFHRISRRLFRLERVWSRSLRRTKPEHIPVAIHSICIEGPLNETILANQNMEDKNWKVKP